MGLNRLDWGIFFGYFALTTGVGIVLSRRQRSVQDYFLGDHRLPWWSILFSIVATETSALTLISVPGLAYVGDLGFLQIAMGYILGRTATAFLLLPRYFEGRVVTAYELLESKFGPRCRRFASGTFLLTRSLADSVRLFATALPVVVILGPAFPQSRVIVASVIILSAVTFIYTYLGGMKAVVWTDFFQTLVYLTGGLAAIVVIGRAVPGGWHSVLLSAASSGRLRVFHWDWGFSNPQSFFAGLIGGGFLSMATHGVDQVIIQRLLATRRLRDAQIALIGSGVAVFLQFALFLLIGTGLHSFYHARAFARSDLIFPSFIVSHLPHGLLGLLLASIFAATMSAHSGALNSLSAAATHDFIQPLWPKNSDSIGLLKIGRAMTLFWAAVLLVLALLFQNQTTPVVMLALTIASFTFGGLLGGFFLALLMPELGEMEAVAAMAIGILTLASVILAGSRLAWPWYVLFGSSVTVLAPAVSQRGLSILRRLLSPSSRRKKIPIYP